MQRRGFLRVAVASTAVSVLGACATSPNGARNRVITGSAFFSAHAWQEEAFGAKTADDVIKDLYGAVSTVRSDDITLDVPVFAESAAMVPVTVSTRLPGVKAIHLMVLNTSATLSPLSVSFDIFPGALAHVATRLWLLKNSDIFAYVLANDKVYFTSVDVQLQSVDGCITHKLAG